MNQSTQQSSSSSTQQSSGGGGSGGGGSGGGGSGGGGSGGGSSDSAAASNAKEYDVYIIAGHGERLALGQMYVANDNGDEVLVPPQFSPGGDDLQGIGWHSPLNSGLLVGDAGGIAQLYSRCCNDPENVEGGNPQSVGGEPLTRGYVEYNGTHIGEYRIGCDCRVVGENGEVYCGGGNCRDCNKMCGPENASYQTMGIYFCSGENGNNELFYGLMDNSNEADLPQGRFTLSKLFKKIKQHHDALSNPRDKYIVHLLMCRLPPGEPLLNTQLNNLGPPRGGTRKRRQHTRRRKRRRRRRNNRSNKRGRRRRRTQRRRRNRSNKRGGRHRRTQRRRRRRRR